MFRVCFNKQSSTKQVLVDGHSTSMKDQNSDVLLADQKQVLANPLLEADLFLGAKEVTARGPSPSHNITNNIVRSMSSSPEEHPAIAPWSKRHFATPLDNQTKAATRPRLSVTIPHRSSDSAEVHTIPHVVRHVPFQRHSSRSLHPAGPRFERPPVQSASNDYPAESENLPGNTPKSCTATIPGKPKSSLATAKAAINATYRVVSRTPVPTAFQGRATHSNSKTWVNPQIKEHERWQHIERNMKKMFHRSKCIPTTYHEYLEHRVLLQKDLQAEQAHKLAGLEASSRRSRPGLPPPGIKGKILPTFGGKGFNDNRSGVLAMPSIWCSWWEETEQHPQALWPCPEEMKEEGDERMTSGFRRFPAMPRVPGNVTVTYKQKSPLKPEKFDKIWRKKQIFARVEAERNTEEIKAKKIEQETARLMALQTAINAVAEAMCLGLTQSEAIARVEVEAEGSAGKNVAEDEAKETEAEYEEMKALVGQSLVAAISS